MFDIPRTSEAEFLRNFQASLTPHERQVLKSYKAYIMQDVSEITPESRQLCNVMLMSFMGGYRYRTKEYSENPQTQKDVG